MPLALRASFATGGTVLREVEVGIGVENSGVISPQTPHLAIRLERASITENLATPDRGGVVDPNILAVKHDAGFGAWTLSVLSDQVFLLHLGRRERQARQ